MDCNASDLQDVVSKQISCMACLVSSEPRHPVKQACLSYDVELGCNHDLKLEAPMS